jgi:phenylalanyl-tRNA synthetase beta chain
VKVSYRWLGRHVDLAGLDAQEVARRLTLHTAEVEGLEPFAPALSDVVVGHVVAREKHPDADKLSVCKVDLGDAGPGELVQIVCGAPNVAAGQRVAVARVGTSLPGDVKIKKGKIRGAESNGMICSVRELGLGDEHDGIWVLPGEPQVGRPVAAALGIEDWVLEIDNKALTHRPDCWGHRGLAREVAALFGRALVPLDLSGPRTNDGAPYPVRVETAGCPRYLGLAIDGVKNGAAPLWMRLLLLAVGQRPLDLLVDLSNFVMLDLGQPNHLFDRRRLGARGITVRDARPGERMTTLDGVERVLGPDDLLICSGDAPVALAGVMGGAATKVDPDTTDLLLEVATFAPARIRRTAMRLGLRTDASARFEKHLDPTLPMQAAGHLVRLLRELQPGIALPRAIGDAGAWTDPARAIALRPARVRAMLGVDLADDAIAAHLASVGLAVTRKGADGPWQVAIPSARATKDLTLEEDLVEEVGRLHGYDAIPERDLVGAVRPAPQDERRVLVRRLQDRLAGAARFHEAPTYSFLPEDVAVRFGVADLSYVEAVNPVLEAWQRIRRGVMPSLLALLEHNLRRRATVRLFDAAKGYLPEHANEHGEPREVHELGLALAQLEPAAGARFDAGALARLQGVVGDLLDSVGHPLERWERPEAVPAWAHPGRALAGFRAGDDAPAVVLAALEPGVARALGTGVAASDVAAACVSLDRLLAAPAVPSRYRPIPRFPGVKVDVAFAVPEDMPAGDVRAWIEKAGKGLVADAELFDLYRGDAVGAGRKSLAYHVVLQADDRTLSDGDQQKFLDRLARQAAELGAELRRE